MRLIRSWLSKIALVRQNCQHISASAFEARRKFIIKGSLDKQFQQETEAGSQDALNMMTDPNAMDNMMNMMKGSMGQFIPQTVMMAWINHFFSGFILSTTEF